MTPPRGVAALLLLASCRPHTLPGDRGGSIEILVRRAVPPDAEAFTCESPVKSTYATTITCALTVASGEQAYRDWITNTLSQRFRLRETSPKHLLFTRYQDAETQVFDIAVPDRPTPHWTFRIVLLVYAD